MKHSLLIVDDERGVLSALNRALMDEGYEIRLASGGAEALAMLQRQPAKVVVSDEMMPGMQGSEFLSRVRELYPEIVRITLTGHANIDAAMRAINGGEIYRFLTKPWDDVNLKLVIRSAMEKYDLEAENRRLLATVRKQALSLKALEKTYPGISSLRKDEAGNLVVEDMMSEGEMAAMMAELEKRYGD